MSLIHSSLDNETVRYPIISEQKLRFFTNCEFTSKHFKMASLQLDKLQPNGMFQTMVHSMFSQYLKQFGVTVNGNDPSKKFEKFKIKRHISLN